VHTSGPWTVDNNWDDDEDRPALQVWGKDEGGKDTVLVADCDVDNFVDVCEGNARLIAAAPDLLEACKKAISVIAQGQSDFWWSRIADLEVNLAVAIAKAEGR
jgi:hypothetical protein